MSYSQSDIEYLRNLGLSEQQIQDMIGAPPINSEAVSASVSGGLNVQPQIPTIEQNISDQIVSTGNDVQAQEAQARIDEYGRDSSDSQVRGDATPTPLTEEQSIRITEDIVNSDPAIAEYYGSNPNATLDSVLTDVVTPPPSSIDVSAMPNQGDIFGTDYGDGATMSTSPTTGGLGDFSDNVTTPIEEQYGEQVTYDTSGNMTLPGQGPQSGIPGIPVASLPGIGGLENTTYRERKKVGFREIPRLPVPGNDVGSPPQNPIPEAPTVNPEVGVPQPTPPPPQPTYTPPVVNTQGTMTPQEIGATYGTVHMPLATQVEVTTPGVETYGVGSVGGVPGSGNGGLSGPIMNSQVGGIGPGSAFSSPVVNVAADMPQIKQIDTSAPGDNIKPVVNTKSVGGVPGTIKPPETMMFSKGGLVPDPMPNYRGRGGN